MKIKLILNITLVAFVEAASSSQTYSPLIINPHQPPLTGTYGTPLQTSSAPSRTSTNNSQAECTNEYDEIPLSNNPNPTTSTPDAKETQKSIHNNYQRLDSRSSTPEITTEENCCTIL